MQDKKNDIVVSVCITAYNHGKYIAQALDSVFSQDVDFNYEVVVGEDCSPDNTRDILLTYKAKYPDKLKLLLHEKNLGGRLNVITTLKNCTGKYIAMLDGDDYWIDNQKLKIQIEAMEKHPECHMSFHPAEARIDMAEHGKVIARHAHAEKIFTPSEVILGGGGFSPTVGTIFRREVIGEVVGSKLFRDVPVGDYFMQILGSLNGGALYIDRVMAVYRRGIEESWTHAMKDIDKKVNFFHALIKSLNDLNEQLEGQYHDEIEQMKSKQYFQMARFYFNNHMFKEFRASIVSSYKTRKLDSNFYAIYYHLRFFPWLINLLRKLPVRAKKDVV